jgi:hypothetical protein
MHLLFTWADELVHHPKVLDAVEDVIGPTSCAGRRISSSRKRTAPGSSRGTRTRRTGARARPRRSPRGSRSPTVSEENGYMQVIPGSHKVDQLPHVDTSTGQPALARPGNFRRGRQVEGSRPRDGRRRDVAAPHQAGARLGCEPQQRPAHRHVDPLHPDLRAPDQGARFRASSYGASTSTTTSTRAASASGPRRSGARRARRRGRAAGEGAVSGTAKTEFRA